ncbi:MAG: PIN domain-containing protein [Actinomycetota bacterium]|nr:PIN domain-containing protein [Actinomycetota bacterium]
MKPLAVDSSVAIPLLVDTHEARLAARRSRRGREVALSGPALAETYSVLTRLSGDLRVTPADAARLLTQRFTEPLLLGPDLTARLPEVLSNFGVYGGAVYDALVGLAAAEHDADLLTRDSRARPT